MYDLAPAACLHAVRLSKLIVVCSVVRSLSSHLHVCVYVIIVVVIVVVVVARSCVCSCLQSVSRNINLQHLNPRVSNPRTTVSCSLQHALWESKYSRGWDHFSRLYFWQLATEQTPVSRNSGTSLCPTKRGVQGFMFRIASDSKETLEWFHDWIPFW